MQAGVANKAKPFSTCRKISRSFQTYELRNDAAGILFKRRVELLLRALKTGFCFLLVALKSNSKEPTGCFQKVERNIKLVHIIQSGTSLLLLNHQPFLLIKMRREYMISSQKTWVVDLDPKVSS